MQGTVETFRCHSAARWEVSRNTFLSSWDWASMKSACIHRSFPPPRSTYPGSTPKNAGPWPGAAWNAIPQKRWKSFFGISRRREPKELLKGREITRAGCASAAYTGSEIRIPRDENLLHPRSAIGDAVRDFNRPENVSSGDLSRVSPPPIREASIRSAVLRIRGNLHRVRRS